MLREWEKCVPDGNISTNKTLVGGFLFAPRARRARTEREWVNGVVWAPSEYGKQRFASAELITRYLSHKSQCKLGEQRLQKHDEIGVMMLNGAHSGSGSRTAARTEEIPLVRCRANR